MAGEEVRCPRCGQRVLAPAQRRPPEPALPADAPPPPPRKSIFPDFPVILDPPEAGVRVGLSVREPHPDDLPPPRPFQATLVALFLVAGGVWAWVHVIGLVVWSKGGCCFWPPMLVELVWGVAAVVRGTHLLMTDRRPRPPTILVLTQALLSGALDLVSAGLGVLSVLLICLPEARGYYRDH